jgi:hypothetical protein
MKTFVDNVAVQVVKASIINNLADVFDPLSVAQMTSKLVSKIAPSPWRIRLRETCLREK